jgi:hypothetical protein
MAGFCELAVGLRAPYLANSGSELPTVSGTNLKYSRFEDCGRRSDSICTAWPARKPYPRFESPSLRHLAQGRVFSRRSCWQLSPVAVAISNSSSGLPTGINAPLFSERPISLRTSGLQVRGTVLENRMFRATYGFSGKRFRRLSRI